MSLARPPVMNWLLLAQNVGETGALLTGGGILILMVVLGLTALAVWIWALVDAIQNPALDSTMRIVWVLVIVFTQIIGAIIIWLSGARREHPAAHKKSPDPRGTGAIL